MTGATLTIALEATATSSRGHWSIARRKIDMTGATLTIALEAIATSSGGH
jgi:hypothetical protein